MPRPVTQMCVPSSWATRLIGSACAPHSGPQVTDPQRPGEPQMATGSGPDPWPSSAWTPREAGLVKPMRTFPDFPIFPGAQFPWRDWPCDQRVTPAPWNIPAREPRVESGGSGAAQGWAHRRGQVRTSQGSWTGGGAAAPRQRARPRRSQMFMAFVASYAPSCFYGRCECPTHGQVQPGLANRAPGQVTWAGGHAEGAGCPASHLLSWALRRG